MKENEISNTSVISVGEITIPPNQKTFVVNFTVSPIGQGDISAEPGEPIEVNIEWEPLRKTVEKTVVGKRFRTMRCPECDGELYVVEYYDDEEAFVSCSDCSEYYHALVKQGHSLKIGRFIIGTSVIIKSLTWDAYLKEDPK
jgi:hypothetical protein